MACLECLVTRSGAWRVRAVAAGLTDPEAAIRLRAAQADGISGRQTLIGLAQDAPEDVRIAAIATLANDDGAEVRALFEQLALAGNSRIRAATLRGMARLGHVPIDLLLRFVRHPEPSLRVLALRGLRADGPRAVEQARLALEDPSPQVVLAAVEILGARGTAGEVPLLRGLRVGPLDSSLKAAVERALGAILGRRPPDAMGGLALAGPDHPEAGRLSLDEDRRGQLSGDATRDDERRIVDLFADEAPRVPADAFASEPDGTPPTEVSSAVETE